MTYRIKNWAKFQHFKDRKPPWVKLYRDLLDDREWHKLDGDAAKMLVSLWLIGSENSGELPEIEELAFRLRVDENKVKKCLKQLEHWLMSTRYQDDINVPQKNTVADIEVPLRDRVETETETETETECTFALPKELLADFLVVRKAKKAGALTKTAIKGIQREADKAGLTLVEAVTVCCELGWQGFNANWYAERQAKAAAKPKQSETFKERDDRNARNRWEEMTGQRHPGNLQNNNLIFDADHLMLEVTP